MKHYVLIDNPSPSELFVERLTLAEHFQLINGHPITLDFDHIRLEVTWNGEEVKVTNGVNGHGQNVFRDFMNAKCKIVEQ